MNQQQIGNIMTSAAPLVSMVPGWGTLAGAGLGLLGGVLQSGEQKPQTRLGGSYMYGGKLSPVSSSSSVVSAPPSPDSLTIKLDNKELVKNNFVYSNRLKEGQKSFASLAKEIETKTGKAEKRLQRSNDPISKKTIDLNNKAMAALALKQEVMATALGKRTSTKGYATGGFIGPGDPAPTSSQPWMRVENYENKDFPKNYNLYYNPYDKNFYQRAPDSGKYSRILSPVPGNVISEQSIQNHLNTYPPVTSASLDPFDGINYSVSSPKVAAPEIPGDVQYGIKPFEDLTGKTKSVPTTTSTSTTYAPKRSKTNLPPTPNKPVPPRTSVGMPTPPNPADLEMYPTDIKDIPGAKRVTAPLSPLPYKQTQVKSQQVPDIRSSAPEETPVNGDLASTKFTAGDYMQMAAMASRLVDAFRKPEVEKANLDRTNITRQYYDPTSQLQQSQSTFQNATNSLTGSENTRRAMASNLYASKLQGDSTILDKYDQMNMAAKSSYEDRTSNQQRFNAKQIDYTNDINAQNRAAALNARAVAFDQVGYAGIMYNQRVQDQARIEALKLRYPELDPSVFDKVINPG